MTATKLGPIGQTEPRVVIPTQNAEQTPEKALDSVGGFSVAENGEVE